MFSKFPPSIPLPENVVTSRMQRRKQMMVTARRGVFLRSAVIVAEILGFIFWDSSSLLVDALSNLFDIFSSLFLIFCIRFADKPPDRNHPLGHGRFEPFAGLQLGLLLAATGVFLFVQQIGALSDPREIKVIPSLAWIIPLTAVVLLEISYQQMKRTAKLKQSPALFSDAVHYRIDGISSLFATVALLFAAYLPQFSHVCDHIGALIIALVMVVMGAFAAKNNLHQLLDRIPPPEYFERIKGAAMRVEGVLATEKLRIQLYGPDAHVGIDIEVEPMLCVEKAHEITQKVRMEIQKEWPAVRDVIVHVEPFYPGDH